MSGLNLTKGTIINLCLLVAVLLWAPHQLTAQINIRGVSIPKPQRTASNTTNKGAPDGNSAAPQGDVQTNPNSPADYNANLNIGDQAVAIDRFRDVKVVRIAGKSGGAYKVAELKSLIRFSGTAPIPSILISIIRRSRKSCTTTNTS